MKDNSFHLATRNVIRIFYSGKFTTFTVDSRLFETPQGIRIYFEYRFYCINIYVNEEDK